MFVTDRASHSTARASSGESSALSANRPYGRGAYIRLNGQADPIADVVGVAMLTTNARGGTTGALVSATKYAAARVFQNGDTSAPVVPPREFVVSMAAPVTLSWLAVAMVTEATAPRLSIVPVAVFAGVQAGRVAEV